MTIPGVDPDDRPVRPVYRKNRRGLILLLAAGTVLIAGFITYLTVLIFTTPGVQALRAASTARPSVILSADGEVIGRFSTDYQAPVMLNEIAPVAIEALIATEDHRFYEHHGLDLRRIVGSAWQTLQGDLQGGSTLTQQLARNLFPQQIGSRRNLNRKLREAITAVRLERHSNKQEILEAYLNTAPFLYNVRGFEMAAQTYFGTSAAQLDAAQAATLVGMLKGSFRYNPVRYPERALERRNVVLAQMNKRGVIDDGEFANLKARPLGLDFKRPEDSEIGQARHFVEHIRDQIVDWADIQDLDLDRDGLVIHTTLDSRLQRLAQQAVSDQVADLQRLAGREWSQPRLSSASLKQPEANGAFSYFWRKNPEFAEQVLRDSAEFAAARKAGLGEQQALAKLQADPALVENLRAEKTRLSSGFVALDPTTGSVRAWVGSPDFGNDQFDHVSQARRQPGSTFKPFVYGAAIAKGISTAHEYFDDVVEIPLGNGKVWKPTDMGGPSGAAMSLREGLEQSKNTVTAQVMQDVGAWSVVRFARAAGVRAAPLDPVPSLALGTSPVSLLEMTTAYSTLASLGQYRAPRMLTHITDREGQVLARFDDEKPPEYSIDRKVAEQLVDVMRGVVSHGTGAALKREFGVRGDLAGKTGTTQNNTDGWFIVMNPGLVAGAWVGFNDQRVTIRSNYWGQGAHNALRIVGDFMRQSQRDKLIDLSNSFPVVVRPQPEPLIPPKPEPDQWDDQARNPDPDSGSVLPMLPMSSTDRWRSDARQ